VASVEGRGGSFGEAFRDALRAAAEAPRPSYTAQSARAQYKHLIKTEAGRAALEEAGLTAAPGTRRRWFGGRQKPGKANAAIIAAAYETMRRGRIPREVKAGKMRITGRVGTGPDVRERGSAGHAPLEVDLSNGSWDRLDQAWNDGAIDDFEIEEIVSADLIEPDIGGSDWWYFPGGNYTVTFTY
jgi:hypothetical protein